MTNPVYKREMRVSVRSFKLATLITLFNFVIALVALVKVHLILESARLTSQVDYAAFMDIFSLTISLEVILVIFIMPSLAAGSICEERQNGTLELLLSTKLTPFQIIMGKMMTVLFTLLLILVSSAPILSLAFMYGGISLLDLFTIVISLFTISFLIASIGIFASTISKKTSIATALSYGLMLLLILGTIMINLLFSQEGVGIYFGLRHIDSWGLLINPFMTFYVIISKVVGKGEMSAIITNISSGGLTTWIYTHWLWYSIALQWIVAIGLMTISIFILSPTRRCTWQ